MTATSALEKVDELIEVFGQRLIPQALQRLSVQEILSDSSRQSLVLPTKDVLGVPPDLETSFNRLVKFLRLHEPTGHEKDVAHKREVMRFLALTRMLQECHGAKLPQVQTVCLERVLEWFEETSSAASGIIGSSSTPILPPRMSPKKTQQFHTQPEAANAMTKSSSEDTLPHANLDVMLQAAVQHKLEKYKMPNLRASHIRRVAQLRSRGVEIAEEDPHLSSALGPEVHDDRNDDILEPSEYEKRERHAKIKATFTAYEPETDAEFAMNQMWLEQQRHQELEKTKEQEVRSKLHSWSMNRSRDESEYLRKQEAMQLAAGLDKYVEEQYEALNQPQRGHLERKKQEWVTLQQSTPAAVHTRNEARDEESGSKGAPDPEIDVPATSSRSRGDHVVVVKKETAGNGPGTPLGSGGMHFRNHLPANFTPQGKRSGGTPQSFSSKTSKSTPSTPLSSSSSGKLQLLDEAAARAEGRSYGGRSSESLPGSDESPCADDAHKDERVEVHFPTALKCSERVVETRQDFKFQPFLPVTQAQQRNNQPLTRVVSTPAINRKLFPRGTLPPQCAPLDPEYRHLHQVAASRRPPLPTTLPPDKSAGKNVASSKALSNQHDAGGPNGRAGPSSAPPGVKRTNQTPGESLLTSTSSGRLMSDLRVEQMQEVERIQILFERHNLKLTTDVLERGLVLPEDRSALECAQNLPLPGCRLISHPLLVGKTKSSKSSKKKKKKTKKGQAKGEKSKTKKAPGDRSPKKSKKK